MLLAAPLALLLIAAAPSIDEGRGNAGTTPEEALSSRGQARFRLGLGGAALFGLATYSPALGVGLTADLGVSVGDRLSLFVHGEVGTIVVTVVGGGGLAVEYALNDHFSVGLGASLMGWGALFFGSSGFLGVMFPLRVNFAPVARAANELRRTGLLIGLQVAPGVSVQQTHSFQSRFPIPPEPGFSATVSVGYGWW